MSRFYIFASADLDTELFIVKARILCYNTATMKKYALIFLILCLCCTFFGCSQAEEPTPTPTAAPTALPEFVPETVGNTGKPDELKLYRDFLELNYVPLTTACGFISGLGLCDLDLDGAAEMLLFDAGASSSMGVQFFDIEDGAVVCVSASRVEVGSLFKGSSFDKRHYVDTVDFAAFRLVELADGQLFFTVTSRNGDDTLRFTERFRFGRDGNDMLTLSCLCCANEGYDPETGEKKYTVYTRDDDTLTDAEYAEINAALDAAADMGYRLSGAFVWENESFSSEYSGIMALYDAIADGYTPAV